MTVWAWLAVAISAAALVGSVWGLVDARRYRRRAEAAAAESKAAADRAEAAANRRRNAT